MYGNLKEAMKQLCVYNMEDGTLAAGEIAAYEVAIGMVNQRFESILKELIPMSAVSFGLGLWEKALGLWENGTVTERRSRIRVLLKQRQGLFDSGNFLLRLGQLCPKAELRVQGDCIMLEGVNRQDLTELGRVADWLLPSISPMAEVALEGSGQNWNSWDALNHHYNFYDRRGLPCAFYETI